MYKEGDREKVACARDVPWTGDFHFSAGTQLHKEVDQWQGKNNYTVPLPFRPNQIQRKGTCTVSGTSLRHFHSPPESMKLNKFFFLYGY
jgi:hypothetical protein